MPKKKIIVWSTILIAVAVAGHSMPVYNRSGYIDKGINNVCIGYTSNVPEYFRIGFGELSKFQEEKKYFMPIVLDDSGCMKPVTLRLYLW